MGAAAGTQGRGREWTVQGSRQAGSRPGSSTEQLCDLGKSLYLSGPWFPQHGKQVHDTQLIWRKCTKAREGSGRAGPTLKALCPALGRCSGEGPESSKDTSLARLQCVNTVTRNSSSGRRSARRPSHTWGCSWFCLSQLVSSQIYPLGLVFKFLSLVLTHCRAACCPLHLVP